MNNRYRIHQVRLGIGEPKSDLAKKILKKIGNRNLILTDMEIIRESVDARDKNDIHMDYTVDFQVVTRQRPKQYVRIPQSRKLGIEEAPDMQYSEAASGEEQLLHRPVIVGFGPCGMFAALVLARRGYRPLVIERGKAVDERVKDVERFWQEGVLDPESNVQFGEGGAGTFSDGKLTTGIKDPRIRKVLSEFVRGGGRRRYPV